MVKPKKNREHHGAKGGATKADAKAHEREVLAMRRGGASYAQIGQHFGYTAQRAHAVCQRALRRAPTDDAADVRNMELARLDQMLAVLWPKAMKDQDQAIERVLRVMKRRAEYLGLDEPKTITQVNVLLEKELNITLSKLERCLDGETYQRVLSTLAGSAGTTPLALSETNVIDVEGEPGSSDLPQ